MNGVEETLTILKVFNLKAILLAKGLKRPPPGEFPVTSDPERIRRHDGNIGICGGPIAILDFDNIHLMNIMFTMLGFLEPTVETGSGKFHVYVKTIPGIPARIRWNDQLVGEIQRGETQYVVAPPSIHPNGKPYKWVGKPIELPSAWREYLLDQTPEVPEEFRKYVGQGIPKQEDWEGPPGNMIVARAREMPHAKPRSFGIKFQCPACAEDGHDKSRDNAVVMNDGRWGCAYAPQDMRHKRAIGAALGVFAMQDTRLAMDKYQKPLAQESERIEEAFSKAGYKAPGYKGLF